ncbi:cyclase family protein [Yoonia sp. F2084L]|uniref:cyclase family protein n=1 Tax=Yoonia sp. F2084L TaxID=2926419 RepID=UPI001FF1BF0B|nr:cyclase family protein [Yoonia sp. F2084L]MCK0096725.1 cyclase family protein [Yoonia sp. F2084L]
MTACIHNHSQWQPGDPTGAAGRYLTTDVTLDALSLVKKGHIIDLGRIIAPGAPANPALMTPYVISPTVRAADNIAMRRANGGENDAGAILERIGMTTHVGTHIDALGHFAQGDVMHGGRSAAVLTTPVGLADLGAEHIPPMVTRGIVLNFAGLDGGDHLRPGRTITVADLKTELDRIDATLGPGDVVCLHTGWGQFYETDPARYVASEPGIDLAAAKYLTSHGVIAIGADTMAVEVLPGADFPKMQMPVHLHCLVDAGVNLIENMLLEPLIAQDISVFCIIVAAAKLKGATGAPARPLALV